jgi:hypothetical protein
MQPQVIQKLSETFTPFFHVPINRMFCLQREEELLFNMTKCITECTTGYVFITLDNK